jgi:hypothetical protein
MNRFTLVAACCLASAAVATWAQPPGGAPAGPPAEVPGGPAGVPAGAGPGAGAVTPGASNEAPGRVLAPPDTGMRPVNPGTDRPSGTRGAGVGTPGTGRGGDVPVRRGSDISTPPGADARPDSPPGSTVRDRAPGATGTNMPTLPARGTADPDSVVRPGTDNGRTPVVTPATRSTPDVDDMTRRGSTLGSTPAAGSGAATPATTRPGSSDLPQVPDAGLRGGRNLDVRGATPASTPDADTRTLGTDGDTGTAGTPGSNRSSALERATPAATPAVTPSRDVTGDRATPAVPASATATPGVTATPSSSVTATPSATRTAGTPAASTPLDRCDRYAKRHDDRRNRRGSNRNAVGNHYRGYGRCIGQPHTVCSYWNCTGQRERRA